MKTEPGVVTYNLGTGKGYSVLEMVNAFKKVTGREIPYNITARRPGDIARCYADPSKAENEMGWTAKRGLEQMCEDSWRWRRIITGYYMQGYEKCLYQGIPVFIFDSNVRSFP